MIVAERTEADIAALRAADVDSRELRDDGTSWLDRVVQKPWGAECEIYRAGAVSITRLVINANDETSLHCHPGKAAVLIVESGTCDVAFLDRIVVLSAGESVYIKRGVFHRARTRTGATLIEVEAPANKRDLVRIGDRYGRSGMGY